MTPYKTYRLIAALVFPLFLFLVGCDSGTAVDPSQVPVAPPDAQGVEVVLEEGPTGPVFEMSGRIVDVGTFSDSTAPTKDLETPAWGHLRLFGQQGDYTLDYKAQQISDMLVLAGNFQLVANTGVYAGLRVQGNIEVLLNENGTVKAAIARSANYE